MNETRGEEETDERKVKTKTCDERRAASSVKTPHFSRLILQKIHGESPHRTKIQKMNFVEKNILFNRITNFIQLWRFIQLICIIQLRPGKLRAALMCNSLVDVFAN